MKRTISSFRPLGAVSASMSVTKPYLYLSSARTCSTVSRLAAIQLLSCMHECFCRILPAATALLPLLLADGRSEEHTSELQSLMRISYAVFCLKKKNHNYNIQSILTHHST